MPYANNNVRMEEWRTCDRCGFLHPVSMLRKQLGLMLCDDHGCIDDISNDRRPQQIANIIKQAVPNEFRSEWGEKLKDIGEIIFDGND